MVDKDVIIERLAKQVEELQTYCKKLLKRDQKKDEILQALIDKNHQLVSENLELRERIARLEKNSSNSSKPPSGDIVNPKPKNKSKAKRKIGGQKGHPKHTRKPFGPDEIDRTIVHKLSDEEVRRRGLVELNQTKSALHQIELPEKLFDVIDHRVQLYRDPNGNIIKAKLPAEVRKAGLFSPRMMALCGYLKGRGHMSYSTLQAFYNDIMDLDISTGFLTKICTQKISAALQPAYAQVAQHIRNAEIVGSDETGHKNPAHKSVWTWCQQTPAAVFFHINKSRGSDVLLDILGADFGGIVICDYFSANKKFVNDNNIPVQFCFAHLIRDMKFLTTLPLKPVVRWAEKLLKLLKKIFELWKERYSRHWGRYKKAIAKLRKAFLRKVRRPPNQKDAKNISDRFDKIGEKRYFLFLKIEGVDPTNNRTEQCIRFVVIDRLITQGTRSWAGMRFCERIWTTIATCRRQNQSVFQFLLDAITSTLNPNKSYPAIIPANL